MACQKMTLRLILVLLFVLVAWQQLAQASKIAYKKPLYGKPAYTAKEKMRHKIKPTITSTSTTTTEPDWPAPVEFIINSSTPASTTTAATSTMQQEQEQSSSTEAAVESSTPEQEQEQEVEQVVEHSVEQAEVEVDSAAPSTTASSVDNTLQSPPMPPAVDAAQPVPCTCGVFLSSQIQNGLPETPLIHNEMDRVFPCNAIGRKQCQTKCLEAIVQHLPNSANIVCGTLGHDCHKERAYLFIKNCHNQWINTNLQAGREYCCKAGTPYRCPLMG